MKKFINRNKSMFILLAITSSILCLLYIVITQNIFVNASEEFKPVNTIENVPKHINIINGDFENPKIRASWSYMKAMNTYLEGESYLDTWNIGNRPSTLLATSSTATSSAAMGHIDFFDYIELKNIPRNGNASNQSLELVAERPIYIYQNFETSPKTRIYINFDYFSPRGNLDAINVYLANKDEEKDDSNIIFNARADRNWKNETLISESLDNQFENSIAFFSEGSTAMVGVNIDNIDIKTPAYLVTNKSSDFNILDLKDVNKVKYTLKIKNYGQVPASLKKITDMLDSRVSSIAELSFDGRNNISYSIEDKKLILDLGNGFLLEPDKSVELSYTVNISSNNFKENLENTKTQATILYSDVPFNIEIEDLKAYSNVYEQQIYKSKDVGEANGSGDSDNFITLGDKEDEKEELEFKLELENPENMNKPGSNLRYDINIENKSDKPIKGIWLRAYVPKYTNYFESDELGEYGYINNREQITWYIDEIAAKSSKKLYYEVSLDYCIAGGIETDTYYEILKEEEKPYYNTKINPKNRLD